MSSPVGRRVVSVRVATRGSRLALAQIEILRRRIDVEPVIIRTSGDLGNREKVGAFTGELQSAVLDGRADVALHCLKDLPTEHPDGLTLAAYLEREDPRDAILVRSGDWLRLPAGAIVATGSVRRTSQLLRLRPDLQVRPLTGNVDTRMERLLKGDFDAIVLAVAGLRRMGWLPEWPFSNVGVDVFSESDLMPAPGQGVLVLESLYSETDQFSSLDDSETRLTATAERAFLAAFGGGCSVPIAAYAAVEGEGVRLLGRVCAPDGSAACEGEGFGSDAELVGRELATQLRAAGADRLLGGTDS